MLNKIIVEGLLGEDFSLEYGGKPVATIHKAGFANPHYAAKAEFLDKKTAEQMLQARQFDLWMQEQRDAGKKPSNQEMADAMNRLNLEIEYYEMRHGNTWVTKDHKGVVRSIEIVDMDDAAVLWKVSSEKVIFRPKTLLPHWLKTVLNVVYFILFLVVLAIVHNMISD